MEKPISTVTNLLVKDTKVNHVTVYQDRALLERSVRIPVPPVEDESQANPSGTSQRRLEVHIRGLPTVLYDDSVRVDTLSAVTIVDVSTRLQSANPTSGNDANDDCDETGSPPEAAKDPQLEQVLALRKEKQYAESRRDIIQQRLDLLEKFALQATTVLPSSDPSGPGLLTLDNVNAMGKFMDYYENSRLELTPRLRDWEDKLRDLEARIDRLSGYQAKKRGVSDFGTESAEYMKYQIVVVVEYSTAFAEPEIALAFSYVVGQASWEALYDVRAFTDSQSVEIAYMANVCQNTGEEWTDVAMALSTAQPSRGSNPPQLTEWSISSGPPVVYRPNIKMKRGGFGSSAAPMAYASASMAVDESIQVTSAMPFARSMVVGGAPPPPPPGVSTQSGMTNTTYALPTRVTLPSDDQTHRVNIGLVHAEAHFKYVTVPKLSSDVFLNARIKNTSDFVLLPGETNVFCDSSFVAKSSLPHVSPQERFECFLGTDPSIRVTRRPAHSEHISAKFFGNTRTLRMTQTVEVTNTKPQATICIVVQDQIPLSNEDKCKVSLVEPRPQIVKEMRLESDDMEVSPGNGAGGATAAPTTATNTPGASTPSGLGTSPPAAEPTLSLTDKIRSLGSSAAHVSPSARLSLYGKTPLGAEPRAVPNSEAAGGGEVSTPGGVGGVGGGTATPTFPLHITGPQVPIWNSEVRQGLLWSLVLKPNEKQTISFKFEVVYPSNEILSGI
ncbi:hypothetical protein H4R33_003653 [Dimargaris cristalligena]|uniref:DUF4139 domain-containing protein n=1 Tax=Dimargaris cristalligena TaxID=215637 RepID=A0A4P9ZUA5_9FUNG|nr:hypothetical protein H4R33_003653 [Dimargaris cristalligena]RKP37125.1 hypothetical protein BJ085DRAFT_38030 [Dimargaris cristalligena]|eukprot:RKP37125.1 hypothetical protein BJ085DRAFT_38030 [Dimargaris cristalligena]